MTLIQSQFFLISHQIRQAFVEYQVINTVLCNVIILIYNRLISSKKYFLHHFFTSSQANFVLFRIQFKRLVEFQMQHASQGSCHGDASTPSICKIACGVAELLVSGRRTSIDFCSRKIYCVVNIIL